MRFIPLDKVKVGETLAANIINANGQVLIREGAVLSNKLIGRIKMYGIRSVYILDKETDKYIKEKIHDTIPPALRQNSVLRIKNSFERFDLRVKKQKKSSRYSEGGNDLFEGIKSVSTDLIEEILKTKNTQIAMMDIKDSTDYMYEHSVNVAVLSLIIGVEMDLPLTDLENLVYGALLIDIGYNEIKEGLLGKEETLSDAEMDEVRKHAKLGYDYLSDNTTFNAHVKSIVMHHHERINGSGYPDGITSDKIHPLAKIITIADVYDALTSDRPYRDAHTQHEAIEYIMAHSGSLFDFEIASLFARKVIPYPVGTYVLLSNGQKGVVLQNNHDYPLRPKLRTFATKHKSNSPFLLDLIETKNVVIEKVIYDLKD